jgi:molybdopterin-guanine dinucleotide biosynthesis protein A
MSGVTGVILAGGLGRRMGGVDKGLQLLRGRPLIAWVLERLAPQVNEIVINANQNQDAYGRFGPRVIGDRIGGFAGPLAGLQAGLAAAMHPLVVTVPCDCPFLPADLVARLRDALERAGADLAIARTGSQPHPVFSLVRAGVAENLAAFLERGGRKIDAWYAALAVIEVPFDDEAEAFSNINTRAELAAYEDAGADADASREHG